MPISKAEFEELWAAAVNSRREAPLLADALLKRHRDALSVPLISGVMFGSEGRAAQAYSAFSQAAAAAPGDARCYLGLAQSLLQMGHHQKAIAAGQQALRLEPNFWQPMLVIADALDALGHSAEAIEQYERLLALGVASPVVHLGLGNALQKKGRLAEAREQFQRVIAIAPDQVAGYCNLGNALTAMGQYPEAMALYRQALQLPSAVRDLLHTNLAKVCFVTGDYAGTEAESRQALAINPDFAEAHGFLAEALRKQGRYAEAVPHFRRHGTAESAAKAVEELYRLGDMAVFAAAQRELHESQPGNVRLAALSVRAALEHGPQYVSRFCAEPLRRVGIGNVKEKLEPFGRFTADILEEARALDTVWEPPAKTTRGGYQTEGNLFDLSTPAVTRLRGVLGESVAAYFNGHAGATDHYVTHWPRGMDLTGWIVRLRRQGKQGMHMHPDGWLSGVLYLQVPVLAPPQGALGFSLIGVEPSETQKPDFQHQPKLGDLVLFPSSLFHYTVPFEGDEERISLAFDLLPKRA